jgi:cytidine deaminase
MSDEARLVELARAARLHAHAPFSHFLVGAALEAEDGHIITGCNVENATYGLTVCAERVAVWKAISEGVRRFRGVAVVADTERPTPPCGACRQILWEFCGDIEVLLANLTQLTGRHRLAELFPHPFDQSFLGESGPSPRAGG